MISVGKVDILKKWPWLKIKLLAFITIIIIVIDPTGPPCQLFKRVLKSFVISAKAGKDKNQVPYWSHFFQVALIFIFLVEAFHSINSTALH